MAKLSDATREKLKGVSTATITTALFKRGLRRQMIQDVHPLNPSLGNMVGVLPGMGPVATISLLLPLTFGMKPVASILMLAGVYYGAQYGGAICSILLNLPCHPPHAVTCLDGYPLTKQGKGGTALGVTVIASYSMSSSAKRTIIRVERVGVKSGSGRPAVYSTI